MSVNKKTKQKVREQTIDEFIKNDAWKGKARNDLTKKTFNAYFVLPKGELLKIRDDGKLLVKTIIPTNKFYTKNGKKIHPLTGVSVVKGDTVCQTRDLLVPEDVLNSLIEANDIPTDNFYQYNMPIKVTFNKTSVESYKTKNYALTSKAPPSLKRLKTVEKAKTYPTLLEAREEYNRVKYEETLNYSFINKQFKTFTDVDKIVLFIIKEHDDYDIYSTEDLIAKAVKSSNFKASEIKQSMDKLLKLGFLNMYPKGSTWQYERAEYTREEDEWQINTQVREKLILFNDHGYRLDANNPPLVIIDPLFNDSKKDHSFYHAPDSYSEWETEDGYVLNFSIADSLLNDTERDYLLKAAFADAGDVGYDNRSYTLETATSNELFMHVYYQPLLARYLTSKIQKLDFTVRDIKVSNAEIVPYNLPKFCVITRLKDRYSSRDCNIAIYRNNNNSYRLDETTDNAYDLNYALKNVIYETVKRRDTDLLPVTKETLTGNKPLVSIVVSMNHKGSKQSVKQRESIITKFKFLATSLNATQAFSLDLDKKRLVLRNRDEVKTLNFNSREILNDLMGSQTWKDISAVEEAISTEIAQNPKFKAKWVKSQAPIFDIDKDN